MTPSSVSTLVLATVFASAISAAAQDVQVSPGKRIGIIGLDTSHSPEFTKLLNAADAGADLHGYKVVAAFPGGSPDIKASIERVPKYTEELKGLGVEIVDSVEALLPKVDVVMLETMDGRPHLAQAIKAIQAGKPLYIDKPLAGSLVDCIAIYKAAEHYKVPVFTSSSLRFSENTLAVRNGKFGEVRGADAYSPAHLEPTHPDLFWYGIHGVELLFTVMGPGCESVVRVRTEGSELVVGTWEGGRIGTFRGIRDGTGSYGGTAIGTKGVGEIGPYQGYRPLVVAIAAFFESREPPVSATESLEIYAFMEAADESKRRGGAAVSLKDVMEKAEKEAANKLGELIKDRP